MIEALGVDRLAICSTACVAPSTCRAEKPAATLAADGQRHLSGGE
jgi:hypothetical protein